MIDADLKAALDTSSDAKQNIVLDDHPNNESNETKMNDNLNSDLINSTTDIENNQDIDDVDNDDVKKGDNYKLSKDESKQLNDFCKILGLCLRCQLRFLGELYSSAVFIGSQVEIKSRINEILNINEDDNNGQSNKKFKSDKFCFCCVGLLENCCDDYELNKVIDKVCEFEYKFKKFQINLSLPVCVSIREQIIYAKLLNKFRQLENYLNECCYSVKDVYKFILIRKISKQTNSTFYINAKSDITIEVKYADLKIDCLELYSKSKGIFNSKGGGAANSNKFEQLFSQTMVNKALQKLGIKGLLGLRLDWPDRCMSIDNVFLTNHSLYVVGRYNKYSRELSQTPWRINDETKRDSLEEIITRQINKHIPFEKSRFCASGREDVDVRMLGKGRPFVVELINPARLDVDKSVFTQIRKDVQLISNNEVDLKDLQFADKDDVATNLKQGEMDKKKTYKALCVGSRPIEQKDLDKLKQIKDLTIQQDTPLRVLHRRTLSTRPKVIHDLSIELIDNESHKFNLTITTEAGTYVKEFVNSDFGRTSPSLETILENCETDIVELDVLDILYDWPPFIDEN